MSKIKKTNNTKSEAAILKTATDLFSRFGIRKVSVEEICRVAELSKMTFYRYYKNKDAVVEAVVEDFIENSSRDYDEAINASVDFPEKVKKLIEVERKYSTDLSEAFLKDLFLSDKTSASAIKIEKAQARQFERMKLEFENAQKDGWINPDMPIDFIMHMLGDISHKLEDDKLLKIYTHPSKLIMDLVNMFFYGIMTTKNK